MTTQPAVSPPAKRRRRFRLSIRVFMLFIAILGVWMASKVNNARRFRRALAEVRQVGGRAYFDFEINKKGFPSPGAEPKSPWYERLLGSEYFRRVDTFRLDPIAFLNAKPQPPKSFAFLADLGEVRCVVLDVTGADDSVMSTFPRIAGLKILQIQQTRIGDPGLEWISQYQGLETLELIGGRVNNRIGDATARRVGQLSSLKSLEIYGGAWLTDSGVEALSGLQSLTELRVHGDHLGDGALAAVAKLPNLQILQVWDIDRATPAGFAPLSKLTNLKYLSLYGTALSGWDMASLSRLKGLTTLSLKSGTLDGKAFSGLPATFPLPSIHMTGTRVSDEAVANLERLERLTNLDLFDVEVANEAIARLVSKRRALKIFRTSPPLLYP